MPVITRFGGGAASTGLPKFTYTGTYSLLDDGNKNWRIKFLTSGTFTPKQDFTIDIFCVGGGSGGAVNYSSTDCGGGGSGGRTNTFYSVVLQRNVAYSVVIGAGGNAGSGTLGRGKAGGNTYFHDSTLYFANGGSAQMDYYIGANGGSGGGGGGGSSGVQNGGTNGGNGYGTYKGVGQGTTTREFGLATGALYSGGGGNGKSGSQGGAGGGGGQGVSGAGNTGGGGGGQGGNGGSGIVVIRNHHAA